MDLYHWFSVITGTLHTSRLSVMSALNNRKHLFLERLLSRYYFDFLFLDNVFNYQYSPVFHLPQRLPIFLGHSFQTLKLFPDGG